MSTRPRQFVIALVVALALSGSVLVVAGDAGFTTTQTTDSTMAAGGIATFHVEITNASADASSVTLDVDLPPEWTLRSYSSDPSPLAFRSEGTQWLWLTGDPSGTTFVVNYTVRIPVTATAGTYGMTANAAFGNGSLHWANTTTKVTLPYPAPNGSTANLTGLDAPGAVSVGENYTAAVEVTNTGNATWRGGTAYVFDGGEYDGERVAEDILTLDPGETRVVEFSFGVDEPGAYEHGIRVGAVGAKASLTVGDGASTATRSAMQASATSTPSPTPTGLTSTPATQASTTSTPSSSVGSTQSPTAGRETGASPTETPTAAVGFAVTLLLVLMIGGAWIRRS